MQDTTLVCGQTFNTSGISATHGNVSIVITNSNGEEVNGTLTHGTYTVTVTVTETIKYQGATATATITVNHIEVTAENGTYNEENVDDNYYNVWYTRTCECNETVASQKVKTEKTTNQITGLQASYGLVCGETFNTSGIKATYGTVSIEITDKNSKVLSGALTHGEYTVKVTVVSGITYKSAEATATITVNHQAFEDCSNEVVKHYENVDDSTYRYYETKQCACGTDIVANDKNLSKQVTEIENLVDTTIVCGTEFDASHVSATHGTVSVVVYDSNNSPVSGKLNHGTYKIVAKVLSAGENENWLYKGAEKTVTLTVVHQAFDNIDGNGIFHEEENNGQYHTWYEKTCACGQTIIGNEKFEDKLANAITGLDENYNYVCGQEFDASGISATHGNVSVVIANANGEVVSGALKHGTYTVTATVEGAISYLGVTKTATITVDHQAFADINDDGTYREEEVDDTNYKYWYEKKCTCGETVKSDVTTTKKPVYTVTLPTEAGFTVTGEASVIKGKDYQFTIAIDHAYEVLGALVVKANGIIITETDGAYVVKNVTENITITVEGVTAKPFYNVTLPKNDDTYTVNGTTSVMKGESYTFTVVIAQGYQKGETFAVKVNGDNVAEANGKYVVENVTKNLTITVEGVVEITFTATFIANGFTDALDNGATTFLYSAETFKFQIVLTQHYTQSASAISVYYKTADTDESLLTADESGIYTISNPHNDVTIIVKGVVLNTYTVTFYRNSVEKHSIDVPAKFVLTAQQLDVAKVAVVNDGEKFNSWVEDVSAPIVENTQIHVYVTPTFGTAVAGSPVVGGVEVTDEYSAAGFEKVYKVTGAKTNIFDEIYLAKAKEVRFAFKIESSWILIKDWSVYIDAHNTWLDVAMTNDGAGTWTVTVIGPVNVNYQAVSEYMATYQGFTLSDILNDFVDAEGVNKNNWYNDTADGVTFYITELRKTVYDVYGEAITDVPVEGFTQVKDKIAPDGFNSVYYMYHSANKKFVDIDISSYSEVKFYFAVGNNYFLINGWGAYAENQYCSNWVPVILSNNGNNSWTITVNGKLTGGNAAGADTYTYTSTGSTLKAVLNSWFVDADPPSDEEVYLTEIRGTKMVVKPFGQEIEGGGTQI